MNEDGSQVKAVLRILNPYGKNVSVYKFNGSGWEPCEFVAMGSYLELDMPTEYPLYCIVHEYNYKLIGIVGGSGIAVIAVIVFVVLRIKKKRKNKAK